MKKSTSQHRSSTGISRSTLEKAVLELQKIPPKIMQTMSLKEAVFLMHDPITQALNKGYSYADMSELLSQSGIKIAPSSLSVYLMEARRRKSKTSRSRTAQTLQESATVTKTDPEFSSALDYVLTKNAELYRRLA